MRRGSILFRHALLFIVLSLVYIIGISERLVSWLLPETHQVEQWLWAVFAGVGTILLACSISTMFLLRRARRY